MVLLPLIIFALGLLIGSFLNVVILRMNTGRSVVVGRSKCVRCNRELAWYELIPVFSFLGLRGKCRTCRVEISFQYPVVELITSLIFMIAYSRILIPGGFSATSWLYFAFAVVISAMMIVITVYDVRHKIIPDTVVLPFILLSFGVLVYKVLTGHISFWPAILGGTLVALPLFLLWYFSKGKAMGFGDVKLMLGIGWLLGLSKGFSVLVLAFWIGGVVGLFLLASSKKYGMKSEVPFGPFIIIALCIVGYFGVTLSTLFPVWH